MLMLNLIKLQHALGASIPNCVIYSKYICRSTYSWFIRITPCQLLPLHFFFPPVLRTVCFTRFIELAVKQVQFERVNTGSFFSWLWRWVRWCEVKIYENKPFKTQVMQNKTYKVYKIMNAPTESSSNSEESVSCALDKIWLTLWWWWSTLSGGQSQC